MQYDTIVIGAGVAGLTAAQQLTKAGLRVVILEAQSYIGGRVKTVHDWGEPIELGASFIHGDQTVVGHFARELGLGLVQVHEDRAVVDADGHVLNHEQKQPYYRLLDYIGAHGKNGVSVQEIIDHNPITNDPLICRLAAVSIGDYEASDADYLDSGAWREMTERTQHNGDNLLIKESYQPLITMLSEGVDIQLNSIVKSIDTTNPDIVTVTLTDDRILNARHVVVTVSLGVLQHGDIIFTPALPDYKIDSITKLGMGNAMKLILRFDSPHNIADYLHYGDGDNVLLQTMSGWWPSPTDPYVITGFTGGSRAKAALDLDKERLIEKVSDDLASIAGGAWRNTIVDYKIVRWDTNPFTRGAYSNHPCGANNETRSQLATPINDQIFWAGEATVDDGNYATVHGAINSGYRVADQILSL